MGEQLTYLDLVNLFWQKDLEFSFSDKEVTLYFYLLNTCNSIRWKNPFGLSNAMTIVKFGWGKSSFDTAKNKLKLAGLIDFKAGDGRGNVYQYEIKGMIKGTQKNTLYPHLSDTLSDTLSSQNPATSIDIDKEEDLKGTNVPPDLPSGLLFDLKSEYKNVGKDKASLIAFFKKCKPDFVEPYSDLWNVFADDFMLPKVKVLSDSRKMKLKVRINDKNFNFLDVILRAAKSDFLKSSNFFAFDWIIENDKNYLKILEGNYDNKNK